MTEHRHTLKQRPMDDMSPEERIAAVDFDALLRLLDTMADDGEPDDEEPR